MKNTILRKLKVLSVFLTMFLSVVSLGIAIYSIRESNKTLLLARQLQERMTPKIQQQRDTAAEIGQAVKHALHDIKVANEELIEACRHKKTELSSGGISTINDERFNIIKRIAKSSGGVYVFRKAFNDEILTETNCVIQWNVELYSHFEFGGTCSNLSEVKIPGVCKMGIKKYNNFCFKPGLLKSLKDFTNADDRWISCVTVKISNHMDSNPH